MTEPKSGFEGMSAFATDPESAVAAADEIARTAATAPQTSERTDASPKAIHHDGGASLGGLKKVGGWILAIGIMLGIKACIAGGVHAVTQGGSNDYPYSSSDGSEGVGSSYATSELSAESTAPSDAGETPLTPDDTPPEVAESADDGSSEVVPSAGYATLTLGEVRYCMAEDIRVSAQKDVMDVLQYSDTDKFNRNVDAFNSAVRDFNDHCANRTIVAADRPTASQQIEAKRSELEMEGRSRVE